MFQEIAACAIHPFETSKDDVAQNGINNGRKFPSHHSVEIKAGISKLSSFFAKFVKFFREWPGRIGAPNKHSSRGRAMGGNQRTALMVHFPLASGQC